MNFANEPRERLKPLGLIAFIRVTPALFRDLREASYTLGMNLDGMIRWAIHDYLKARITDPALRDRLSTHLRTVDRGRRVGCRQEAVEARS